MADVSGVAGVMIGLGGCLFWESGTSGQTVEGVCCEICGLSAVVEGPGFDHELLGILEMSSHFIFCVG